MSPRTARLALPVLLAVLVAGPATAATPPVLAVRGADIIQADGKPVRLRGFNAQWWCPVSDEDLAEIRRMGANCIRHVFGYQPKGGYDRGQLAKLEPAVRSYTAHALWVVPCLHNFTRPLEGKPAFPWTSAELQREYLALMEDVVVRLRDDPLVVAWEPINEPHDGTAQQVADWYRQVIPRIRALDPLRPIVVAGTNYSWPKDLGDHLLQSDGNIIYAFHFYAPFDYTHVKTDPPRSWPGAWGRDWLRKELLPAKVFGDRNRVPVWCGEWGVRTSAPGYGQWLTDTASLLEELQFHWTHWAWCAKGANPGADVSFDVNQQKPGIHGVLTAVFAEQGLRRPPPAP